MAFIEINPKELDENFIKIISKEWMLVAAGDSENYNMMTASWGSMGEMWGRDCAVTVIRPDRYTYKFVDSNDFFSLSFYGDNKKVHEICGSNSGRDINKTEATGLTPVFENNTVYFEQARLVFVCKKIFKQPITPDSFLCEDINKWYGEGKYHVAFIGEIVKVLINN